MPGYSFDPKIMCSMNCGVPLILPEMIRPGPDGSALTRVHCRRSFEKISTVLLQLAAKSLVCLDEFFLDHIFFQQGLIRNFPEMPLMGLTRSASLANTGGIACLDLWEPNPTIRQVRLNCQKVE